LALERTILLVDDTPWFRELGAVFLARSGRVVTAGAASEALVSARAQRPDLVIADYSMPGASGADLCRALRNDPELRDIPVIIVIRGNDPADHACAVRSGANDVLTKPLSRFSLLESVSRLTRAGSPGGQPRVPMSEPLQLRIADTRTHATLRNVSRGGVFIDAPEPIARNVEVSLDFCLPGTKRRLEPTAQVVWSAAPRNHPLGVGLGMRFLDLDTPSVRLLEEFVFANAAELGPGPAGSGVPR
jgi:uncharacterized protein (TIGR02266 family)